MAGVTKMALNVTSAVSVTIIRLKRVRAVDEAQVDRRHQVEELVVVAWE